MTEVLKLTNITKIYDNGVVANRDINMSIDEGEIHAIVGENGAGKSTLMKILFGLEQPTHGTIYLRGEEKQILDVNQAIGLGIGMVHQHFMLIPSFTVTQNVVLGMEPKKGLAINYKHAQEQVETFAKQYKFNLDVNEKVENISVGMKQKVEIIKALIRGAKILILDEPTAVLTPQETLELFEQLKLLKASGHTIIFITHKLKEVAAISDKVTVIKKGKTIKTLQMKDTTIKEISNLMVGRDVSLTYDKVPTVGFQQKLAIKHLNTEKQEGSIALQDVHFAVPGGKILGVAGVEGNGQNELVSILTGEVDAYEGTIEVLSEVLTPKQMQHIRDHKVSYIPEDRMEKGIAEETTITDNYIASSYKNSNITKNGVFKKKNVKQAVDEMIENYQVLCKNGEQIIGHLSGGNIQKVVVGRECDVQPEILIAEQPTRGVDLGAAEVIHHKLLELREQGTAILLISADINEVIEVSDSLIVMYDGAIVAYIKEAKSISEQMLGEYMLGVRVQTPAEIKEAFTNE